jgi:phosphocarrier protein HPr
MERVFRIKNKLGLHARATAQLVQLVNRYDASCTITKDDLTVNGKSIMGVLTLAASKNSEIKVTIEGPEADAAMNAIEQLIENKFGEQ